MSEPAPRPPARAGWPNALLTGFLLVCALTWPTVPHLATDGRLDSGDGKFSIWNVGWIGHAILTQPFHLFDANIFVPHTGTLAYSELNLVAGVLGFPAYLVTRNAIAATNMAIVLGLLLAFLTMWALVRRLTGSHEAGLVSAIAFTFCPYLQAHTPHIQLLMAFGIPLVLLAFHEFRDHPGRRQSVALGAALAIAGLACAYYGIFAGLALAWLVVAFASRDRLYWRGLAVAAGVVVLIVAPVFLPYLSARRAVGAASEMPLGEIENWSATAAMYRSSPTILHEKLTSVLAPAPESLFPGFLTLGLAVVGVVEILRRRVHGERRVLAAYLALFGLAVWTSFGPKAGLYSVLMHVVPAMGFLRAPSRIGIVVVAALAVLAGFGVRGLAARARWVGWGLGALMAVELASVPWPLVPRERVVPRAYTYLASAEPGVVVEFPFMYRRQDLPNHVNYMFRSTRHWQPLVNGYSDVIPEDFVDMAPKINAFPDAESFEIMKRLNVKYVIWHFEPGPGGYDPVSRDKILARIPPYAKYLSRVTVDRDVWLYEITEYP